MQPLLLLIDAVFTRIFGPSYRTSAIGLSQFMVVFGTAAQNWADGNALTVPDWNAVGVSFAVMLQAFNTRDKNVTSEVQANGRAGAPKIHVPKAVSMLLICGVLGVFAVNSTQMIGCTAQQVEKFDKVFNETKVSMQKSIDEAPTPEARADAQAKYNEYVGKAEEERRKLQFKDDGTPDWIRTIGGIAATAFPASAGLIVLATGVASVAEKNLRKTK